MSVATSSARFDDQVSEPEPLSLGSELGSSAGQRPQADDTVHATLTRKGQENADNLPRENSPQGQGAEVLSSAREPLTAQGSEALQIGSVLGKYLLVERLGSGSTGLVFRALHQTLNIPVAVKVLRPTTSANERTIYGNLKREAQLLAQLNHPHIVRVWDFEDNRDFPYLVLEHVEGLSLEELIRQSGRLRLDRAAQIICQVASGLGVAWKIGVIHRDVKPGNILLDREGNAKLADLGQALLARPGPSQPPDRANTASDEVTGTPAYMAPEQFVSSASVDYRADIYALGASFYHMLTGQVPFTARTYQELLCKHTQEQPVPPHQLVPDLGPEVAQVLGIMMAKDPNDRYQSYEEVLAALAGLLMPKPPPPRGTAERSAPSAPPAQAAAAAPEPQRAATEAEEMLQEALAALQAGKRTRAAYLLRAVTALDPRNEVAWLRLATVIESPVEVLYALQRVLEINPNNERARAWIAKARLHAGIAEAKAGNKRAARAYLTQVVRKNPRKESAWMWLASVARTPKEAMGCLQRVLKINPDNRQARRDLAWYRAQMASEAPPGEQSDSKE